jgi:hypothetical protein
MPPERPDDARWLEWPVAVFVCSEAYAPGVYRLGDLAVPSVEPRLYPEPREPAGPQADRRSMIQASELVALETSCKPGIAVTEGMGFRRMARRNGAELWVRVDGARKPPADAR